MSAKQNRMSFLDVHFIREDKTTSVNLPLVEYNILGLISLQIRIKLKMFLKNIINSKKMRIVFQNKI